MAGLLWSVRGCSWLWVTPVTSFLHSTLGTWAVKTKDRSGRGEVLVVAGLDGGSCGFHGSWPRLRVALTAPVVSEQALIF